MTSLRSIAFGIARKTREVGVIETAKTAARKLLRRDPPDAFDLRYGTDTTRKLDVYALGATLDKLEHANRYEAIPAEIAMRSLEAIPFDLSEYTFIDLGAGKGRSVMLASLYPFKRVIGVELSPKLTHVMAQNFELFTDTGQRCKDLKAICADALEFEFPDSNLVLFLFNPFDAEIMQTVVNRLEKFAANHMVYVIYRNPKQRAAWDRSSFKIGYDLGGEVTYVSKANTETRPA